jgi:hypothetical protein
MPASPTSCATTSRPSRNASKMLDQQRATIERLQQLVAA